MTVSASGLLRTHAKFRLVLGLVLTLSGVGAALQAAAGSGTQHDPGLDRGRGLSWVPTWATASKIRSPFDPPTPILSDVTLRQVVRISVGGRALRVWLTNEFGTEPLVVGAAHMAVHDYADAVVTGSIRQLRFAGQPGVIIAPGAKVLSDPVHLRVSDLVNLAVSMHLPQDLSTQTSPASYHVRALQTSYIAPGDQSATSDLTGEATTTAWFYLAGVDVKANGKPIVVAALGDSITDGDQDSSMEPIDQNARYTNFLAERLARRGAVINLGISGNQVTSTFIGDNLQARLDRDVLAQAAVTHIVIQGGINDIGLPPLLGGVSASAADIISGLQQIAARARAQGLIVIGATLSPSGSYFLPTYTSTEAQAIRRAVNDWIRTSDSYDLVADFDAALRDPDDTDVLNPIYSADGLHPNSEGYRLMARVVARLLKR